MPAHQTSVSPGTSENARHDEIDRPEADKKDKAQEGQIVPRRHRQSKLSDPIDCPKRIDRVPDTGQAVKHRSDHQEPKRKIGFNEFELAPHRQVQVGRNRDDWNNQEHFGHDTTGNHPRG